MKTLRYETASHNVLVMLHNFTVLTQGNNENAKDRTWQEIQGAETDGWLTPGGRNWSSGKTKLVPGQGIKDLRGPTCCTSAGQKFRAVYGHKCSLLCEQKPETRSPSEPHGHRPYYFKIHFNIMLPWSDLPSGLSSRRIPNNILYPFYACYMACHFHYPWFIIICKSTHKKNECYREYNKTS